MSRQTAKAVKAGSGMAKSEVTRGRILDAAIELFRKQGFEATTMREIAAQAGVAGGAAYYYFESKNAIVLAFYDRSRREMAPQLEAALESSRDLGARLAAVIEVKLRYFLPNRDVFAALTGRTSPSDPLSPFSEATREIREEDMRMFGRAINESRQKIPADLAKHLPRLLWLYQMGIILFWIHDASPDQRRTHDLLDSTLDLIVRLIRASALPFLAPLRRRAVRIVETLS